MPRLSACSGFSDPEAAEIVRFGLAALETSAAIFYWVDGPLGMADVELEGLHPQFFNRYAAQMIDRDPLYVRKMVAGGQRVERFRAARPGFTMQPGTYGHFLSDHGVTEVIDLLFWSDGVAVAGLGLMKLHTDPPVSRTSIETALALHRFVEHNIHRHSRIAPQRRRRLLLGGYRLTDRESDVAELTVKGHTNAEIAALLKVSLPTVKTHLLRVLAKTGCGNRTHLAATLTGIVTVTESGGPELQRPLPAS
jgi:DNA-binding CsgD family transcriptional regulator